MNVANPSRAIEYAIVIPTLGRRETLQKCLDSIARQTRAPAEVILVAPAGVALDAVGDARVVHAEPSTSGQRNAGARATSARVVLFLDDDIVLEPDFGEALMEVWDRRGHDALSGVVGTCVGEDAFRGGSRLHRALRAVGGLGHGALRTPGSRLMASGHVAVVRWPKQEEEVAFASGYCVSYRRDLLAEEPFDESFGGYVFGEDLDVAARMSKRAPLVHTPNARCSHEPVTPGLGGGPDAAYRRARMWAFFRGRHRKAGLVGRAAWEYANATEGAILLARALRSGEFEPPRAFLRGLREARAQLRAEALTGPSGIHRARFDPRQ